MLFGNGSLSDALPEKEQDLALLPKISPWGATFLRNLKDFFLFRDWPRLFDYRRYEGWRTAYVNTKPAWSHIRESWHGHLFVISVFFALWTLPFPLFRQAPVLEDPLQHAEIKYYPLSDYLPAVNDRAPRKHSAAKADPVYAKQEIISVRPNPESTRQTIITPPNIKLPQDVPLPNIAIWTAEPVPPPVSVPSSRTPLIFPAARPEVIQPPVDPSKLQARLRDPNLPVTPVEPAVDPSRLRDRLRNPDPPVTAVAPAASVNSLRSRQRDLGPQASAVQPAANADALRRRPGALNVGNLNPEVVPPAPALPLAPQRATGFAGATQAQAVPPQPNVAAVPAGGRAGGGLGTAQAQAVPPQPVMSAVSGTGGKATGQIIALSVQPADVRGPIRVPAGNRSGEFAAGPSGKPSATGAPGGSDSPDGAGTGAGNPARPASGPEGIYVGAPAPGTPTSPVAGPSKPEPPKEFAKIFARPSLADIARQAASMPAPAPDLPSAPSDAMARKVFAGKRYYSLTLNMPNLTSVTGSWVIRFAELKDTHDGIAIGAPIAMNKVDPAYPQELVHDRVEGTVALYAVIHSDGTVGEIRVLRGVDRLLDASAVRALAGWRFQPGTKNGAAIDLEAVVEIPFRLVSLTR